MNVKILWNRILYGSVQPAFYLSSKMELDRKNHRTVRMEAATLLGIDVVFDVLCLATSTKPIITYTYLGYTAAFLVLYLLLRFSPSRRMGHTGLCYYVLYTLAFSQTLIASAVFSPNDRMVTVFFVMIILPVLYIERPVWSYLTIIVSCALAICASILVKHGNSKLLSDDELAVLACGLASISFITATRDVMLRDIQSMEYFREKSEKDVMTDVYNREGCMKRIRAFLDEEAPCALMMMDIDDFKQVNDRRGHVQGDRVLQLLGQVLRNRTHREDVVGRFGGDEFVVLLKDMDDADFASARAGDIRSDFTALCQKEGLGRITCCIGIAIRSARLHDFDCLYRAADKALYHAKVMGKDAHQVYREEDHPFEKMLPLMIVADDDPTSRTILRLAFQEEYNVVEAEDGEQALELVSRYCTDLSVLLLDLFMPEIDGYEVLRRLKANQYLKQIPVIVITADSESELAILKLGADDQIEKPFEPDICRIRVRNALKKAEIR